jgi:hypothetical protein
MSQTEFTSSLMDEYVHATDCNLATLEHYCMVKKFSQSDILRQGMICERMLTVCNGFPDEYSIHSRHSSRIAPLILEARKETHLHRFAYCITAVLAAKVERDLKLRG